MVIDSCVGKMSHYNVPGRDKQPIELMRDGMTDDEFGGYCVGNVIKYVLRHRYKDGVRDLQKAKEYIEYLIRAYNNVPIIDEEDEDDINECHKGYTRGM